MRRLIKCLEEGQKTKANKLIEQIMEELDGG
jgi:hypothetical protein